MGEKGIKKVPKEDKTIIRFLRFKKGLYLAELVESTGYSLEQIFRVIKNTKSDARHELKAAVKKGEIERRRCKECGDADSEGHHDDYLKPLTVIWLCRQHHIELHRGKAVQNMGSNGPR